jgi:RNA polymerase sigma-70 factor (ECF subfamily)
MHHVHEPDGLEALLLSSAQAGDEHAFRQLVELQRSDVEAHCYRMLGSLQEAEDAYQDTLLRAWRALDGFDGRSRFGTWVHRIATNVCLSALARNPVHRALPAGLDAHDGFDEAGAWLGPYPDVARGLGPGRADPSSSYERREAVELAFVAALQLLPARQRAALILREVVGLSAAEIAAALETTVPAVNSAIQRARARLDAERPVESQQATARALGDARVAAVVAGFAHALEEGDARALARLLSEDVVFEMPPESEVARGSAEVARSWLVPVRRPTGLRTRVTVINAQPAVAVYRQEGVAEPARPIALDVLTLSRDAISRITAFRVTESFGALGLPEALPPCDDFAPAPDDVRKHTGTKRSS